MSAWSFHKRDNVHVWVKDERRTLRVRLRDAWRAFSFVLRCR